MERTRSIRRIKRLVMAVLMTAAPASAVLPVQAAQTGVSYRCTLVKDGKQTVSREKETSGSAKGKDTVSSIQVRLEGAPGHVRYRVHTASGWSRWRRDGAAARGPKKDSPVDAFQIRLEGKAARHYSIAYRYRGLDTGWSSWKKDGKTAGSVKKGKEITAFQISIAPKEASSRKQEDKKTAAVDLYAGRSAERTVSVSSGPSDAPGGALSKEQFEQMLAAGQAPSLAELKETAMELYGMDEASFNVALGWLAGDNIAEDNYWNYFSACCPINAFVKMGAAGFQSYYCNDAWSGGRGYYTPAAYAGRAAGANENLRRIFYIALTNRDPRPTEANGMAPENGLAGRSISQAIYKTRGYSYELGREIWWGVWA